MWATCPSAALRALMSICVPMKRRARPSAARATTLPRVIIQAQVPSLRRMRCSHAKVGARPLRCSIRPARPRPHPPGGAGPATSGRGSPARRARSPAPPTSDPRTTPPRREIAVPEPVTARVLRQGEARLADLQRLLGPLARGDVREGPHRPAIGQRHGADLQHGAVRALALVVWGRRSSPRAATQRRRVSHAAPNSPCAI